MPERRVTLLVLRRADSVLLEQRPPAGIWGGLLSLPELPEGEPASYCANRLGLAIGAVTSAPNFSHGFTHFRLHIQPLVCEVTASCACTEPALRWVRFAELAQTALPAPVRKFLATL